MPRKNPETTSRRGRPRKEDNLLRKYWREAKRGQNKKPAKRRTIDPMAIEDRCKKLSKEIRDRIGESK